MHIISQIDTILPEFILIAGAMILLMLGVFKSRASSFAVTRFTCLGTIAFLLVALVIVMLRYNQESVAFSGMIDNFAFTSFIKSLILIAAIVSIAMFFAENKASKVMSFEMPILAMISIAGMMFVVSSNSLIALYVSLEIMSLPLYLMAASDRNNSRSSEAGLKYFILGSLSSGLFLFGASLIYGYTGQIGYDELIKYFALSIGESDSINIPVGVMVGLVFITVAVCFKVSAVPFHMWTPDVYQGAPTVVTAFFAAAPKIAGLALFVRLMLDPFGVLYEQWIQILVFISMASMIVGGFGAIMQRSIKRLLAYSSIGHIGFALTGLVSGDAAGIQGLFVYISIYASMVVGTFALLLMLREGQTELHNIEELAGLSRQKPAVAAMMAVLMLSQAGIPPLAGFFAKFYVLLPVIKQQLFGLALVFVLMSVISAFYYLRVVKVMYFDTVNEKMKFNDCKVLYLLAMLSVLFNLLFIFSPTELLILGERAAVIFLD